MKCTKIGGAFVIGLVLGFLLGQGVTKPQTPVESPKTTKEVSQAPSDDSIEINIPPAGTKSEITTPKENELVTSPFAVAGNAAAFENQILVSVYDADGKELSQFPAYTHGEFEKPGPFVELVGFPKAETSTGTIEIWDEDAATGKKTVLDSVNIRFR